MLAPHGVSKQNGAMLAGLGPCTGVRPGALERGLVFFKVLETGGLSKVCGGVGAFQDFEKGTIF